MTKKYIIGFGTGRCGTKTLASLLNGCKNVNVSHEFRERGDRDYRLSWKFNAKEARTRVENLKKLEGNLVGDVAHYYLNYIPHLREKFGNDIKFVNLFRPSEEVYNSFLRKTKKTHWIPKDHPKWKSHEPWTRTFPQYSDVTDNEHGLNNYLRDYYITSYTFGCIYTNQIFYIETKDLNKKEAQKRLFDFLEIPEEDRVYQNLWENRS